ncbi:MAG: dockerin type I repeat-containing protein [Acidobacteriota bacterium]
MKQEKSYPLILHYLALTLLCVGYLGAAAAQAQPVQLRLFCGDCNLDNRIDELDALAAAEHATGSTPITGPRRMACDVDRNGIIDVIDAQMIEQVAKGIIPSGWRGCPRCGDCSATVNPPFTPDGSVDANDLNAQVWHAMFQSPLVDSGFAACDVTGDGIIDTFDDFNQLSSVIANPGTFPVCGQCGDCNLDGVVNATDAQLAADAAGGLVTLNGLELGLCDINGNQSMDVLDALKIAQGQTANCWARP